MYLKMTQLRVAACCTNKLKKQNLNVSVIGGCDCKNFLMSLDRLSLETFIKQFLLNSTVPIFSFLRTERLSETATTGGVAHLNNFFPSKQCVPSLMGLRKNTITCSCWPLLSVLCLIYNLLYLDAKMHFSLITICYAYL